MRTPMQTRCRPRCSDHVHVAGILAHPHLSSLDLQSCQQHRRASSPCTLPEVFIQTFCYNAGSFIGETITSESCNIPCLCSPIRPSCFCLKFGNKSSKLFHQQSPHRCRQTCIRGVGGAARRGSRCGRQGRHPLSRTRN